LDHEQSCGKGCCLDGHVKGIWDLAAQMEQMEAEMQVGWLARQKRALQQQANDMSVYALEFLNE
jgi:uncharacterized membrane protein YccC